MVDDDPDVRELLGELLTPNGFTVQTAGSAAEALEALGRSLPDIVLLDLGLGDRSGFDVLREIELHHGVAVIVVSGHDQESDRVVSLELGADDFVTKPVPPRELTARIRAVLRRVHQHGPSERRLDFGRLVIDDETKEVTFDGELLGLTAREFELLTFLARSPRRVYSRTQLLDALWGSADWVGAGTLNEHVHRIRRKLRQHGAADEWITSVRGLGYRFEPQP